MLSTMPWHAWSTSTSQSVSNTGKSEHSFNCSWQHQGQSSYPRQGVRALTLGQEDDTFCKVIGNVNYGCQVIQEAVVTKVSVGVGFAVASTTIEFV